MYVVGILLLVTFLYLFWNTYRPGIWNRMVASYPSISNIETTMPEYYIPWKRAVEHAENIYEELLKKPLRHNEYPY